MAAGGDPAAAFVAWCGAAGVRLSPKVRPEGSGRGTRGVSGVPPALLTGLLSPQVRLSRQGTVSGYGLVAGEELAAGELLVAVPRPALLSQHTCGIRGLLRDGEHREGPQSVPKMSPKCPQGGPGMLVLPAV